MYGENLYAAMGVDDVGKEAVDAWYNEMALFNPQGTERELVNNHESRK